MAAARQTYSITAATRVTTTSTTAQVAATLTFTPDASSTYWIMAFALVDTSGAASNGEYAIAELFDSTAAVVRDACQVEPWTANNQETFFGLDQLVVGASPASQTYTVRYRSGPTVGTVGISDVLILAIKADAADVYAEARSTVTTTLTTPQTAVTLAWTPATAGTYVVLAKAEVSNGSNPQASVRLSDGTNSYGDLVGLDYAEPNAIATWGATVGTGSLSGAQSWTVRYYSKASGTTTLKNAALLALRVDALPAAFLGARVTTASTTTSATMASFASVTGTTAAFQHLVLGYAIGGLSDSSKFQLVEDSTLLALVQNRTDPAEPTKSRTHVWGALRTPTAASHTYAIQRASTTTANSTEMDEAQVVAIQLGAAAPAAGLPPKPLFVPSPAAVFLAAYTGV